MISTVFYIALLRLWNNKQELLLAFVVPILFFSIFAVIFGSGVAAGTPAINVAIVDDDDSTLTREIVRLLKEQPALEIDLDVLHTSDQWPLTKLATAVVQDTRTDVVIYLPKSLEDGLQTPAAATVQLLSDGTNPVGRQIVNAMLRQVIGLATAQQQPHRQFGPTATEPPSYYLSQRPESDAAMRTTDESVAVNRQLPSLPDSHLVNVAATDLFAADKHNPKIAMYAAGIAVMFLLFSATGAGGSLLEEYEAGTLDRLLSSRLSVTELLAGKWLFITCLGCVQLSVMFLWAQLAFGVDLFGHLQGFAVIAVCTAAATASFAMCLAVACRTRASAEWHLHCRDSLDVRIGGQHDPQIHHERRDATLGATHL